MNNVVLKDIEQIKGKETGESSQLFCYSSSTSKEMNERHLRLIFQRFDEYGLTISVSKCVFMQSEMEF